MQNKIAIIGTGNLGTAIARGLTVSNRYQATDIILTRRKLNLLGPMKEQGFMVADNLTAVKNAAVIIVAVEPQQIDPVLDEIGPELKSGRHTIISVVTGVSTDQIRVKIDGSIPIVRAMPNTAIAVRESMTCLTSGNDNALEVAREIFETVGTTLVIDENRMIAATALGACGVAFFLRAVRAASQGGIEIGFHSQEAIKIAAQTAKGAASLLLENENHPEDEIDRVTTPRGCTIAGLNQMEHEGFSSAMIKGITLSARNAAQLYSDADK